MAGRNPEFQIQKDELRKLRLEFIAKMDNLSSFMDIALSMNLFRRDHNNEINSISNVDYQIRKLLDFMEKKLPSRSDDFLEALLKSGNDVLAQKLVPSNINIVDLRSRFGLTTSEIVEFHDKYRIENFTKFRVEMVRYMSDMPTFMDYALQINLFNDQHKNEIISIRNADQQTRKMCDIMEKKLPESSDAFLYALTESGNEYLADQIKSVASDITLDFSHLSIADTAPTPTKLKAKGDVPCYPMQNRGRVLIIENAVFHNTQSNRYGSEKDREAIEKFFGDLRFKVIIERNKTPEEMKTVLNKEIHDPEGIGEDIFILFIMSHGEESEICGVDGKCMNYSVIFHEFNTTDIWKSKPKLIFIQACQPIRKKPADETDANRVPVPVSSNVIQGGHFYIMFATIPGDYANRHTVTGSRLIQSLIKVYRENYRDHDVESMGIDVKPLVYKIPENNTLQIALCHSSLTKRVYLGFE